MSRSTLGSEDGLAMASHLPILTLYVAIVSSSLNLADKTSEHKTFVILAIFTTRKICTEHNGRIQPHYTGPRFLSSMLGDGKGRDTISTTTPPDIHVHSLEELCFRIT